MTEAYTALPPSDAQLFLMFVLRMWELQLWFNLPPCKPETLVQAWRLLREGRVGRVPGERLDWAAAARRVDERCSWESFFKYRWWPSAL